jgi:hypothetical protein
VKRAWKHKSNEQDGEGVYKVWGRSMTWSFVFDILAYYLCEYSEGRH